MYNNTQVYTSPQRRERKQVGKKESTPCKNKLEKNLILIDFFRVRVNGTTKIFKCFCFNLKKIKTNFILYCYCDINDRTIFQW